MIHCRSIEFQYNSGTPRMTFTDVSCAARDQLLLLGQSGSGKTTLLHLLCGMLQPTTGEIEINGQILQHLNERELDQFRGRNFGIVFQKSHFIQSLTVLENLAIPAFLAGEKFEAAAGLAMLEQLGIGHKAHERPRNLSIGEQQRVGIARALIHRPAIVLADEPTSALDDESTEAVISLLEAQASEAGATLVIVTHDQRLKDRYAQRIELNPLDIRTA
jgi:ABC-type lipoprotein export system ATPase subunit